ncbi:MAG: hypothetical protein MNPFHGCM_00629 [Gemmatimonadaceae bacterium]|nr:hypothetical protein [Gemmatimonadaceae bacterium]
MRFAFHFGGRVTTLLLGAALVAGTGCGSLTDSLLQAEDPDLIMPENARSAAGSVAVANGALGRLRNVTAGSESTWLFGGLLADEWGTSSTFIQNDEADWRKVQPNNSSVGGMLRRLYQVRTYANQAIPLLKEFQPTRTSLIGEMYFARGFAELQLASDFCNGIPLSDGSGTEIKYGGPLPVSKVFEAAIASFDTALKTATGTDAQSVLVQRAAKVGMARAQLGNGLLQEAAATVAGIPTDFRYQTTFSLTTTSNIIWDQGMSAKRYTVADNLEGNSRNLVIANAIPFYSAKDPRLPVVDTKRPGQDGGTFVRTTTLYDRLTPIDVVNGVDARLIEAEAALKRGSDSWLTILNALRNGPDRVTSVGTVTLAALPDLTDPGTADARVNLVFYEKAFWTFSRGQRLGDLRRLIRQYNRTPATTFPVGTHYKTTAYGDDVNFPIHTDEENNKNFKACTDRNA